MLSKQVINRRQSGGHRQHYKGRGTCTWGSDRLKFKSWLNHLMAGSLDNILISRPSINTQMLSDLNRID